MWFLSTPAERFESLHSASSSRMGKRWTTEYYSRLIVIMLLRHHQVGPKLSKGPKDIHFIRVPIPYWSPRWSLWAQSLPSPRLTRASSRSSVKTGEAFVALKVSVTSPGGNPPEQHDGIWPFSEMEFLPPGIPTLCSCEKTWKRMCRRATILRRSKRSLGRLL